MDPDANLKEQLEVAQKIINGNVGLGIYGRRAERLAELVIALNDWISNGGFLPEAWRLDDGSIERYKRSLDEV